MQENTMWPEKIEAIYAQFSWLEKVYSRVNVSRAYVKKIEPYVLDITSDAETVPEDLFFSGYTRFTTSVYLADQNGIFITVGQSIVNRRRLFFWKGYYTDVTYFNQSIRYAIQNLPEDSTATHVVLVQHGKRGDATGDERLTRLTVFKPVEKGLTLRQWYQNQVAAINSAVVQEVESV